MYSLYNSHTFKVIPQESLGLQPQRLELGPKSHSSSLREPAPQRYRDTAWGWQPFLGLLLSPLEGPRPVLN